MSKKVKNTKEETTELTVVNTETTEENPAPTEEKKRNWIQQKVDTLKTPEGKQKAKKIAIGVGTAIVGAVTAFFAGAAWMAAAGDDIDDDASAPDEDQNYTDVDDPISETEDDASDSETAENTESSPFDSEE